MPIIIVMMTKKTHTRTRVKRAGNSGVTPAAPVSQDSEGVQGADGGPLPVCPQEVAVHLSAAVGHEKQGWPLHTPLEWFLNWVQNCES